MRNCGGSSLRFRGLQLSTPDTGELRSLPIGQQCRGVRGLAARGTKPLISTLSRRDREGGIGEDYSTVTDLARLRGWSMSHPRSIAQ